MAPRASPFGLRVGDQRSVPSESARGGATSRVPPRTPGQLHPQGPIAANDRETPPVEPGTVTSVAEVLNSPGEQGDLARAGGGGREPIAKSMRSVCLARSAHLETGLTRNSPALPLASRSGRVAGRHHTHFSPHLSTTDNDN